MYPPVVIYCKPPAPVPSHALPVVLVIVPVLFVVQFAVTAVNPTNCAAGVATLFAMEVPPLLNNRMSDAAGCVLGGDQFDGVFQSLVPEVGTHVYVCAAFDFPVKLFPPNVPFDWVTLEIVK